MKGIKFNNIHSYTDLDLILSACEISPAEPKTTFIDIPGADGALDLTEALGEVKFGNRSATFTFTMNPMHGLTDADFELKKTEVSNKLNGLKCDITLDKDPSFYYVGRVIVNSYRSDKRLRQIVVGATLQPYKQKTEETVVTKSLSSTATTIVLTNGRKTVTPTLTVDGTAKVVVGSTTYNFSTGEHRAFQLYEGETSVVISGSGTLEIRYKEGEL